MVVLALACLGAQKTKAQTGEFIYLPLIQLPPEAPYLQPIDGYDINHSYTVGWSQTDASTYILQEATTANFSDAKEVYRGPDNSWTTPSGKLLGTFFYRVASLNEYGTGSWSNVQSIIVNPPIAPSLSTVVDPEQDHIYAVIWSNTDAISYILQEATTSNFSDATVVYQGANLSWTTPSRKAAGTYFYRVAAVYPYGGSYWSGTQSIVVHPAQSPILNPISTPDINNIYTVTWSNTNATAYWLQEATKADFSDVKMVYQGAGLSWKTPTGKTPGTYYYRVAAIYPYGGSLWSSAKSIVVQPPKSPTLISISNPDINNAYTVTWSNTNATAYWLQEATKADFSDVKMVYQGAGLSWTTPTGKIPGTYYYRVAAIYPYGGSLWSSAKSITVGPPKGPTLSAITNTDYDNTYAVTWVSTNATEYWLQEATKADFSDAVRVYQGPGLTWTPSTSKLPGTYFYRVAAIYPYGGSLWSNVQSIKINPLFVGLKIRWDGEGFIRLGSLYENVGTHETKDCGNLTDIDTLQCYGNGWYSPNPLGFDESAWYDYFSPTTGQWKGGSSIGDPAWKWSYSWKLGYGSQFASGETVTIDGQKFTVTGPHSGLTTYGKSIKYWQFVNQNKILYYEDPDEIQYVHPGEAILRYDAGGSGLLLYSSIKRTWYEGGAATSDTVQYIKQLTSSTSLPGSPAYNPYVVLIEKENEVVKTFNLHSMEGTPLIR